MRAAPVLICVALGWLVGDSAGRDLEVPALILALAAGGAGAALSAAADPAWRRVALVILAAVAAYLAAHRVYHPGLSANHIAAAPTHVALPLEGVLLQDAEAHGEGVRLLLAAQRIDVGSGWVTAQGRVLLSTRYAERVWHAGDTIRAVVSLRHPRNFGNPGEFDYEGYLARRGIYVTAFAEDDATFERTGAVATSGAEWLARWRHGVGALFHRMLPAQEAAVLSALIIGTKGGLPPTLRKAFTRAGVSHVLSISGLHIGLVAAVAYLLFRWLLARSRRLLLSINVPKLAVALSVVPVLLYVGLAGGNVATVRAGIMVLVYLGAVLVDRQGHLVISLAVAAIVILLWTPGASLDISFQLSFAAVLGLVVGLERFWAWWKQREEAYLFRLRGFPARIWRAVAGYAAVSVCALAATMPLAAFHFNQLSLVAPLANALVVPLLGSVAVPLGLLAAVLQPVCEPLACACVLLAAPVLRCGVWLVDVLAAPPYAAVRVVTPTLAELAFLYVTLGVLLRPPGRLRTAALVCLALLAFADGTGWAVDRYWRSELRITFLSVGDGDSAVVEFPGSTVMVIDGGGLGDGSFDVGERIIAPFLWSRKIAHVDYLVLSHPQWDHYGGLAFLAAQFTPTEFWSNGMTAPSAHFQLLQRELEQSGVRQVVLHRGAVRHIGAVEARVLAPSADANDLSVNDRSLVLALRFGGAQALFSGDIGVRAEKQLVSDHDGKLASAILKVPHHGSRTSSSPAFVDAVAPRVAVVSAGFENRFGFPRPEVLRRYAAHHCTLVRTDLDGAVLIRVGPHGDLALRRYRDEETP